MKYSYIGKTNIKTSQIGLGTFEIGGGSWWEERNDIDSIETINYAIDQGINFIDTAPVYGFGHSERIIGKLIKNRRKELIISTKCGEDFSGTNAGRFHYRHDDKDVYTCLTKKSIINQVEQSLKNLSTDYIDILYIHFYFDDPNVGDPNEIMETFDELKKIGKIRALGISNINYDELMKLNEAGQIKFDCCQVYCNILDYYETSDVDKYLIKNGISGIAINTLAKGLLAGAFPNDYKVKEKSERSESAWFNYGNVSKVNSMLNSWDSIKHKYKANYASISNNWVLSQNCITHSIVGATKKNHIDDILKSTSFKLSIMEYEKITTHANQLRKEMYDKYFLPIKKIIEQIIEKKEKVAIWGGGITLDYLKRKLPFDKLNIINIYDANENFKGVSKFGVKIKNSRYLSEIKADTTLLITIPYDINKLNTILEDYKNIKSFYHLGHLKALCK